MIRTEHICLDSQAHSKRAIITELANILTSIDPDNVMQVVMAREQLGSTGIGHGVALPHGRMPDLAAPIIALARHTDGVDFDAIDGKPVHIVVLLLVPDSDDQQHLELLAKLARNLQQTSFREQIMQAENSAMLASLFADPLTEA
ncbi:MAG: PTS sugar transporter subunit IIA [Mariprofundus sp.]|nr:PTS sugar transporter subunit IIA [Mariprofundus sp.]